MFEFRKIRNFFAGWGPVSFSGRTLLNVAT